MVVLEQRLDRLCAKIKFLKIIVLLYFAMKNSKLACKMSRDSFPKNSASIANSPVSNLKNYRWIQTLTTHSSRVSLDINQTIQDFRQVSVWNLNIHNRQSNKQVFFSLEFVNILLQMEAKPVKKCVFTSLIQRS